MSGATQMLGIGQLRLWIENHCLFLFAFAIIVSNFTWLMNFQRKLHITWKGALLIAALHNIIGYSAMKALAIIETGGNIDQAADMRLFGAIFILPAFYALVGKYTKSDSAVVMDIAAVCLVIGLICGRLN